MWEQKRIRDLRLSHGGSGTAELRIYNVLIEAQTQVVNNALRLWRIHWTRTIASTRSVASTGLYRERALAYWLLGHTMNHNSSIAIATGGHTQDHATWTEKVPQLLRRLTTLLDAGQLDLTSDVPVELINRQLDCYLKEIDEQEDENTSADEMDAVVLSAMMRRASSNTVI